jgi:hypothetical protein
VTASSALPEIRSVLPERARRRDAQPRRHLTDEIAGLATNVDPPPDEAPDPAWAGAAPTATAHAAAARTALRPPVTRPLRTVSTEEELLRGTARPLFLRPTGLAETVERPPTVVRYGLALKELRYDRG